MNVFYYSSTKVILFWAQIKIRILFNLEWKVMLINGAKLADAAGHSCKTLHIIFVNTK